MEELPRWIVVTVVVGAAALQEVGKGVLQAIGAQAVEAIKRLINRAAAPHEGDGPAEVWLRVETTATRDGEELRHELTLCLPRPSTCELDEVVSTILEKGLVRMDELSRTVREERLVYDRGGKTWLTYDELHALRMQQAWQRRSSPDGDTNH